MTKRTSRPKNSRKRNQKQELIVPNITENDLLAFQLSHFGDDTKPNVWFVDAQLALDHDPAYDLEEPDEDDDLGYYEDGAKRILTDEQIEMFRHSEMEQLIRDGILAGEEHVNHGQAKSPSQETVGAPAMSPVSSIEEELVNMPKQSAAPVQRDRKPRSPSTQSDVSQNSAAIRRKREKEVPYDQRKKRKWEGYIEDVDPEHGSRTHRRIVRELDEQRIENVELEY